jgi:hypothetical protein
MAHRFNSYPCSLPRIKDFVINFSERSCPMTCPAAPETAPALPLARRRGTVARALAMAAISAALGACSATDDNHPLRGPAAVVGWSTTVGPAKDFVVARRSGTELAYVPIGRGGVERPMQPRSVEGVRALEQELDGTRDRSEAFARRAMPRGAYGAPFPSVAAPPRPARAASGRPDQPTPGAPESYPVSPDRARQLRENARNAQ